MTIVAPPKVTLTYSKTGSEFSLKVTEIKKVSYTLEYNWHSLDSSGKATTNTDALTNTQTASTNNTVTDKQIAGTKSSEDVFLHDVQGGTLHITAETTDGKTLTYQNTFTITETGTVKSISEQSSIKNATAGAVLGTSDEATASATTSARNQAATMQPRKTQTSESTGSTNTTNDQTSTNLPLIPLMLGISVGIALVGVFGLRWYQRRQKSATTSPTSAEPTSTSSQTTEAVPTPPPVVNHE